jgi:hypothetical protein
MGKGGPEALFTDKRDITGSNRRSRSERRLKGIKGNNERRAFSLGVRKMRAVIYYDF